MLYFNNSFQYIVHTKINYLRSKKLPASGGFAPNPITRGSALGPRWGHSPRPPSSAARILAISLSNQGRLDKTLLTDSQHKITSLPKVIWEEGRVSAKVYMYAVKSPLVTVGRPKFAPKSTPSRGPILKRHYLPQP